MFLLQSKNNKFKSFFSPLSTINILSPKKSLFYEGYIKDIYGEIEYEPGINAKPPSFQDDISTIKYKYHVMLNNIRLQGVKIKNIKYSIDRKTALLIFLIDHIGNNETYSYVDIIKFMLTKTQVLSNIDIVYYYLMGLENYNELNIHFSKTENFSKLQLFSMMLQKLEYHNIEISDKDIVLTFISKHIHTELNENIIFDLLFDLLYCEDNYSSDEENYEENCDETIHDMSFYVSRMIESDEN